MAVSLTTGPPTPAEARAIRERAGWPRLRMATELGVTEGSIVRWESGQHMPAARHLLAYMRLLNRLDQEHPKQATG